MIHYFQWSLFIFSCLCSIVSSQMYYRKYGHGNIISRDDTDTVTEHVNSKSLPRFMGISWDENSERIYWSDGLSIQRAKLDGTIQETIASSAIKVILKGYKLGDSAASSIEIKIKSYPCTPTIKSPGTHVECVAVLPVSLTILKSDIIITTSGGVTIGETAAEEYKASGYQRPLPATIELISLSFHPQCVKVQMDDYGVKWIYWSDTSNGRLFRMQTNGLNPQVLIENQWDIEGITTTSTELFYASSSQGTISKISQLGTLNSIQMLIEKLHQPRGLTIDSIRGLIYFIEQSGRIYKMRIDGQTFKDNANVGSNIKKIELLSIQSNAYLTDIIYDANHDYIYWTETNANRIARASLNIKRREVFVGEKDPGLSWPWGIILDGSGNVYITEYVGRITKYVVSSSTQLIILNQITSSGMQTLDSKIKSSSQIGSNVKVMYALE